MKTYIFHGPSGSGKDTQLDLLNQKTGNRFEVIGSGDMFRYYYEQGDEDGIKARGYWNKGKWVPDDLTYKLLAKWVERFDEKKPWVFVSVVRTYHQIRLFEELIKKKGRSLDAFIHFDLSEEKAVERMANRYCCKSCGAIYHTIFKPEKVKGVCDLDGGELYRREDDKPEKIIKRLEEYNKDIDDIIKHYEMENKLMHIDADRSIEEISRELMSHNL